MKVRKYINNLKCDSCGRFFSISKKKKPIVEMRIGKKNVKADISADLCERCQEDVYAKVH